MEELAWSLDSPLWGALAKHSNEGVPSSRSVSLSLYEQRGDSTSLHQYPPSSTLVSRYSASPMKVHGIKRPFQYEEYGENAEEHMHADGLPPRMKRANANDEYEGQQEYAAQSTEQPFSSSIIVFFRKVSFY